MIKIDTSSTNLVTQRILAVNTKNLQKSMQRLSTGVKINGAVDDPTGMALSVNLDSQLSGIKTVHETTKLSSDFLCIADGALSNVVENLQRMNAIAIQAASGTISDSGRMMLQAEMNALSEQIGSLCDSATMNGVNAVNAEISNVNRSFISDIDQKSEEELIDDDYVALTTANYMNPGNTKFYISSADELQILAAYTNYIGMTSGRTFALSADIDLSSVCSASSGNSWSPIGADESHVFEGTFDGNGHVVSNLYISPNELRYAGLFGYIESGEIKNLGIEKSNINTNDNAFSGCGTGVLAGYSDSAITNCYATGKILSSATDSGGLIGVSYASVTNCYTNVDISGISKAGGLIGLSLNSVANCYTAGNVYGEYYAGGIVAYSSSTITNSYATGNIKGNSIAGGLVGQLDAAISNSYATGNVNGNDVGGVVGCNNASITNCYATGLVNGVLAAEAANKASFNSAALTPSGSWDLSGDNPVLKISFSGDEDSSAKMFSFHISDGTSSDSDIEYNTTIVLKIGNLDVSSTANAKDTLAKLQSVLSTVTQKQAYLGTMINRLEDIQNNQSTKIENYSAAISTVQDTDVAKETANFTEAQILQQVSLSVLKQSNNANAQIIRGILGGL